MTLTLEKAIERCAFWQGALRLQDWDVEVQVKRRRDMPSPTALGATSISKYRRAIVRLVDPCDYGDDDWAIERDMEATLVHELLHLHFFDLGVTETEADGTETHQSIAQERAIESIARALIGLARIEVAVTTTGSVFS